MSEPIPSQFRWPIAVLTLLLGLAAVALYVVLLPGSGAFDHLQYSSARLPTPVRIALTPSFGMSGAAIGTVLGIVGALVKRRAIGRALSTIALISVLAPITIGVTGWSTARSTCAYAASPGLERCDCSRDAYPKPRECHCDSQGTLRELFFAGEDWAQSPIAERLFFDETPHDPEETILRIHARLEGAQAIGETFSLEGTEASVDCDYPEPCDRGLGECGPCAPEPKSIEYAISPDLRCVDLVRGQGSLRIGFLHLRRTIWADDGADLPSKLDQLSALKSDKNEILGDLDRLGDSKSTLAEIVLGNGRAPELKKNGARLCRTTAGAAGSLVTELERELPPEQSVLIRIESVTE
jgi:hypothetical protein